MHSNSRTPANRPSGLEPRSRSFVEQAVDSLEQGAHVVEKGMQTAATLHTLWTVGRGLYTGARALAPLMAVL
jgi:hypothetical protein